MSTSTHYGDHHRHHMHTSDRHSLTQSFVQFSRGLALDSKNINVHKNFQGASPSGTRSSSLKVPQVRSKPMAIALGLMTPFQSSINRSPSAPDLVLKPSGSSKEASPTSGSHPMDHKSPNSGRTFAACALLNPGLLHRQALSVDETGGNYR